MALILGLASCQPHGSSFTTSSASYSVFGTIAEVQIRHPNSDTPDEALVALDQMFQRLHRDWHPWEVGALMNLNHRLNSGEWTPIASDLWTLLQASQTMEALTEGHFNAAIGELVNLWGFHTSVYPITEPPPAPRDIEQLSQLHPSTLTIAHRGDETSGFEISTDNTATRLDFSGIAKGGAAKKACELLLSMGFEDALVNLGGDVMICGPATKPWRVAIKDPKAGVLEVLEIAEPLAVFTSGQYYRYGEWSGERYAHVLDPKTGYPIEHVMQATAIHPDPLIADAAATALVVAGSDHAPVLAKAVGLKQWLIVDDQGQLIWSGD